MRPLAEISSLRPTSAPRAGDVGVANLGEPSNANLTDLGIKERVAWLFLKGLGVDRSDVTFTPRSPLAYMETPLEISNPPQPFHKTSNHRLLGVTIDDKDYPVILAHDGQVEHVEARSGNIMLWSPTYIFSETEERIVSAAKTLLERETHYSFMDWPRISYPSYGRPLKHIVSFPGIYSPTNPYVKPLIRSAIQRIHGATYRKDNIRTLVLGCGAGIEAAEMARFTDLSVDTTDINPLAVANTKASAILADQEDNIRSWVSDGLKGVRGKYDFILFCAPVFSSNKSTDPNRFDPSGQILTGIFNMLPNNLNDGGRMLVMNHDSIDDFVPSHLASERVQPFSVNGHPYAIHQVTVK